MRAKLEAKLSSLPRLVLSVAVALIAAGLRVWTLRDERAGNPLFADPVLDDAVYLRLAVEGPGGAWFLAPLFPTVLRGAAALAGGPPTLALAQGLAVAAGSLTAAVVALAARTIHSSLAGWVAGLVAAGAGALVFSDVLPGQEPLLCLLSAAALLAAVHWLRAPRPRSAAVFGLLVGVAMLGRTTSIVVLFAFVVLARRTWREGLTAWRGTLVAMAGMAAVLVPAAFWNGMRGGDVTPLPWSGGPNLYVANGPTSREYLTFTSLELGESPDEMERNARRIAESAEGRPLRPAQISSWWAHRTWEDRGDAGRLAAHLGRKALLFWSAREVANNHSLEIERRWSTWLSLVPVGTWWILAFGAAGWWVARRGALGLDVALLAVGLSWAALTVVFPVTRYVVPALPLAVVALGCGASELALRGTTARRGIVALAIVAAAFGVSRLELRDTDVSASWDNLAQRFAAKGDALAARDMVRRGLAEHPGSGYLLETSGRLLLADGHLDAALADLERARLDERTRWTAAAPAVYVRVLQGRLDVAEAEGRAALGGDMPPAARAELLAYLALAAHRRGDRPTAAARLAEAQTLDPASPAVAGARAEMAR